MTVRGTKDLVETFYSLKKKYPTPTPITMTKPLAEPTETKRPLDYYDAYFSDEWIRVGWQSATHCHRCGWSESDGHLCSYGWCDACNSEMTVLAGG